MSTQSQKKCETAPLVMDETLLKTIYDAYNTSVFGGRLPSTIPIVFDDSFASEAAGQTKHSYAYNKATQQIIAGSLRSKILISKVYHEKAPERVLKNTVLHEMCHAAVLHIDHVCKYYCKDGHGPHWHKWADRASAKHPEVGKIMETMHGNRPPVYEFICGCTRKDAPHMLLITRTRTQKERGERCLNCRSVYVAIFNLATML